MHIVVKVEAVCKSYGLSQVINNCSFQIHQGEIYGLLILDEPLNGLDPIAIADMGELMRKLAAGGMSILLSSHIIGEIRHTADRIGILSEGYIRQEFSVEDKVAECGEKIERMEV